MSRRLDYSQPIPGRKRAICCVCGTVRTCGLKHQGRGERVPEGLSPERLARVQAKGVWLTAEPSWRVLAELKCAHCGKLTRHAVLRDHEPEDWANHAEQEDYDRHRPARQKAQRAGSKLDPGEPSESALLRAALLLALEIIDKGTDR